MELCPPAERASVTGSLVEGQQLDLKIPVTASSAKSAPGKWVGVLGLDGLDSRPATRR